MSNINYSINSITTIRNIMVYDQFTTTDGTPTTAVAIPLAEGKGSVINVTGFAVQSGASALQFFEIQGGFRRAAGGNVIRVSAPDLVSGGDYIGSVPVIDLVANIGNQTIDITIRGKVATTIKWYIAAIDIFNLD